MNWLDIILGLLIAGIAVVGPGARVWKNGL